MRRNFKSIVVCLAGFSLIYPLAFAQEPTSVKVGVIEEKIKEDAQVAAKDKRPQEGVAEAKTEACVTINKFVLNGATIFNPEDFSGILSEYKDKCLGLKEFSEIAYKVQRFYRTKGYITTMTYIPVQKITDNTLEIRVVEGYIGAIGLEGGKF